MPTRSESKKAALLSIINDDEDFNSSPSGTSESLLDMVNAKLTIISEKFDAAVREIIDRLDRRDEKFDKLENDLAALKRENESLKERLDDIEASDRMDTIILSGEVLPLESAGELPVEIARDLLRYQLKYEISPDKITDAYRVGKRSQAQISERRRIAVRLSRRDVGVDIVKACKTIKPDKFYINESLIPVRADILYVLRQGKRLHPEKIAGVGTMNGRVYAWIKAPDPGAKNQKMFFNNRKKLDEFCEKTLCVKSCELMKKSSRQ